MSTMKLGFNDNISNEQYHSAREYVSSSGLKLMNKCPREFYKRYVKGEASEEFSSVNLIIGSLVHTLVLEPHLLEEEYALYTGQKNKSSNEYKEWAETVPEGKTIITQPQLAKAHFLKDVTLENEHAKSLLCDGNPEQTLCAELDGIKIKVRADYLQGKKVIDLKTTSSGVTYDEVQASVLKWEYALSAALYVDCFTQYTGEKHDFYFVFIGKSPMGCEVYKASERMLEYGRKKYKKAIAAIKKARETGVWFNEGVQEIDLPEGF